MKQWSDSDLEFLTANYLTMSRDKLAEELSRTRRSIDHKMLLLGLRTTNRKFNLNEDYFRTWSSRMAYILGFTTADGSVSYSPGDRRLSYGVNSKDRSILEFISSEISNSEYPIVDTTEYRNGSELLSSRMRINSRKLVESLIELGITPRKTGKEVLPKIPYEFKKDYLRGLFDGDGCIYICNKSNNQLAMKITSASNSYLESVKNELGFDIGYVKPYLKYYIWHVYKQKHIKQLYDYMYETDSFYLRRKKDKFNYE